MQKYDACYIILIEHIYFRALCYQHIDRYIINVPLLQLYKLANSLYFTMADEMEIDQHEKDHGQKPDKMFTLKKWNLVAMWSWDVECDTCAICRVQVMGNFLCFQLDAIDCSDNHQI